MTAKRSVQIVLLVVVALTTSSSAQINWMSPLHGEGITMEASFVRPDNQIDFSSSSAVYSISARYWPVRRIGLVMEFPCAKAGRGESVAAEYFGPHAFGWTLGNPFVGLEFITVSDSIAVIIGGRIPLADKEKISTAHFDTLAALDRPEAFIPKMTTAQLIISYRSTVAGIIRPRIAVGPSLLIPNGASAKAFANYSAELWYIGTRVNFGIGVAGRCWLPIESRTFDERTTHQFGAAVGTVIGRLRPGLHIRFPLDEISKQYINDVYGLDMTVDL